MLSSVLSKSFCRPLISNRKALSFASHSLDSSSLFLNVCSACDRSSSAMLFEEVAVVEERGEGFEGVPRVG